MLGIDSEMRTERLAPGKHSKSAYRTIRRKQGRSSAADQDDRLGPLLLIIGTVGLLVGLANQTSNALLCHFLVV
jgi:hypothetical protein